MARADEGHSCPTCVAPWGACAADARASGFTIQTKIAAEQLETNWSSRIPDPGEAASVATAHRQIAASGAVMADLGVAFASENQRLRMVILTTGELGGFTYCTAIDELEWRPG